MKKDPKIFLKHIIESIEAIESRLAKITKEEFEKNITIQDAVIRRIEIIGEAVKNLPAEFKRNHLGIEWRKIAGMRDKLIHEYFGISLNIVWTTARRDLPKLKKQILGLLEKF